MIINPRTPPYRDKYHAGGCAGGHAGDRAWGCAAGRAGGHAGGHAAGRAHGCAAWARSAEYGASGAECGLRLAECGARSMGAERGVQCAEYRRGVPARSAECGIRARSTEYGVRGTEYEARSTGHGVLRYILRQYIAIILNQRAPPHRDIGCGDISSSSSIHMSLRTAIYRHHHRSTSPPAP
jgi:hypothetical protein